MNIKPDLQILSFWSQNEDTGYDEWTSVGIINAHATYKKGELREHAEAEVLRELDTRRSPSIHPDEWEGSPGMIGLYGVTDPFRPKYDEDWDLYYALLQQDGTHQ